MEDRRLGPVQEASIQQQILPAWRWFAVTRCGNFYQKPTETLNVGAHAYVTQDGILIFITYTLADTGEVIMSYSRMFKEWLDVEEINTSRTIN